MLGRLLTMMFKRVALYGVLLCFVLLLSCCIKEKPVAMSQCSVHGSINVSRPNGVKVTLENVADHSLKYISVSDANGNFEIHDIEAGTYSVNAEKEDFRWVWMVDDGVVNHRDRLIVLSEGQAKELSILMNSGINLDFNMELTDVYGNLIGDEIYVPRYSTTVSFRIYNGTDQAQEWQVYNTDRCIVFDDTEMYSEYTFSSFHPTSGVLVPGDNVLLVGTINQEIFEIRHSVQWPYFNELEFWSDGSKRVLLDIEFSSKN